MTAYYDELELEKEYEKYKVKNKKPKKVKKPKVKKPKKKKVRGKWYKKRNENKLSKQKDWATKLNIDLTDYQALSEKERRDLRHNFRSENIKDHFAENKAERVGMTLDEWKNLSDDERQEKLQIFKDDRKKAIETKLGNLVGDVKSGIGKIKETFGTKNKTIDQTLGIDFDDPNLPTAIKEYKDQHFVKGQKMNYSEYVRHIKNIKELMGQKSTQKDVQFDIYKSLFESHPEYIALSNPEKKIVIQNLYKYIQTKDTQFKSSVHKSIDKEKYDSEMLTNPKLIRKRMMEVVSEIDQYKNQFGEIKPEFQDDYDKAMLEYKELNDRLQKLK